MRFHFCMVNHRPLAIDTLAEQVTWLSEGLEKLGHTVSYSNSFADGHAINLLWECFAPDFARSMKASGYRYGIIASEIPDGRGFNHRRDGSWPERWEGFAIALSGAEFVWSLVPEGVPLYQAMGCKATYLEYGFSERLRLQGAAHRDIDFLFYGGCGTHRQKRINKVCAFHPGSIITNDLRDAILARSKVVLGLKYHKHWKYTSASRVGRAILAGCAVAHEQTEHVLRPANFVPMAAKGQDWRSFARGVLKRASAYASDALDRYAQEMPIRETTGRALEVLA